MNLEFGPCYVRLQNRTLVVGNAHGERTWRITDNGMLAAHSLRDKIADTEWLRPVEMTGYASETTLHLSGGETAHSVHKPCLRAILSVVSLNHTRTYTFRIFPDSPAIGIQLCSKISDGPDPAHEARVQAQVAAIPTGIEPSDTFDYVGAARAEEEASEADYRNQRDDSHNTLFLVPRPLCFTSATFYDQTDRHNELVFEQEWLLHPSETPLVLPGNLFWLEDTLHQNGLIFLQAAPLPASRPQPVRLTRSGDDITLSPSHFSFAIRGHGYETVIIPYSGGKWGRIAALQTYQKQIRPFAAGRDGLFLSNTWGDRNRDARINHDFLIKEIQAASRLGVDVLQIDDGWQKGTTANSVDAHAKGGVWEGFHKYDGAFWDVNPIRFPQGLAPLIHEAREKNLRFGLWFAPDSADDFANFEKDADTILRLYHEFGVDHIKIDGVKLRSKQGEKNLRAFFDRVLRETNGNLVFDGDVTAETRPGYFGMMDIGPLFVENRYTDWHGYWPHHTLRNLWALAHYVDPSRLRMEFLNNARNSQKYADDPLAPHTYRPDYLFATVLFAAPLGWFEVSELPDTYFETAAPLIGMWKQHRNALHEGIIFPIGAAPNGASWTGFVSVAQNRKSALVLLFRERHPAPDNTFFIPHFAAANDGDQTITIEKLAGDGEAFWTETNSNGGNLTAHIPETQRFLFLRLSV